MRPLLFNTNISNFKLFVLSNILTAVISIKASAAPQCSALFFTNNSSFSYVQTFIENKYLLDNSTSEIYFKNEQKLIDAVVNLTTKEREQLIQISNSNPPMRVTRWLGEGNKFVEHSSYAADLHRHFKWLLYDKVIWKEFFDTTLRDGISTYGLVNDYAKLIIHLPDKLKLYFLSQARDLYPIASARKNINPKQMTLVPKRAMDGLLRLILRPDLVVLSSVKRGLSPLDSYREYFKKIQGLMGNNGFSNYSADTVLSVAKELQIELKKITDLKSITMTDEHDITSLVDTKNLSVTISGSFPNALAKVPTSDIDISTSHFMIDRNTQFYKAASNALAKFNLPPMEIGETHGINDSQKARLNSFLIKVTNDHIYLIIYPPPKPTYYNEYNNSDSTNVRFEGETISLILD